MYYVQISQSNILLINVAINLVICNLRKPKFLAFMQGVRKIYIFKWESGHGAELLVPKLI